MATAAYPGGSTTTVNKTTADAFLPELWSDEVIASYKSNLVVGNLVSRMNHNGKKGDIVHIPSPYRGDAAKKSIATAVTIQANTELEVQIAISQHWEYSRLIEDIVGVQALGSARQFYTDDAGYSLARRLDRDLMLQLHYLNNGNTTPSSSNLFETAVIGSDGSTAFSGATPGNGAALTDLGIRTIISNLDDNDVPMQDRYLVIPPVEKKSLTGIPRFTEQAFVGETGGSNTIRNGLIGDLYGVKVYVSTNCPWIHNGNTSSTQVVNFSGTTLSGAAELGDTGVFTIGAAVDFSGQTDNKFRVAAMFHKSALVLVEQMGVRMQTQYKQEYLADLMTADTIYGVGRLRDGSKASYGSATAGYAIVVAAS